MLSGRGEGDYCTDAGEGTKTGDVDADGKETDNDGGDESEVIIILDNGECEETMMIRTKKHDNGNTGDEDEETDNYNSDTEDRNEESDEGNGDSDKGEEETVHDHGDAVDGEETNMRSKKKDVKVMRTKVKTSDSIKEAVCNCDDVYYEDEVDDEDADGSHAGTASNGLVTVWHH